MKCKQCGAEVSGNTKFCTKCGASLPEEVLGSKGKTKGNMVLKIVLVVLGIVVFLALIGLFVLPSMVTMP